MNKRKLIATVIVAVLALPFIFLKVRAGNNQAAEFFLFSGGTVDSTENVSPWIPIRGANRILLRSWSGKAAWAAATDPDSGFTDTISTFRVAFSDSVIDVFPTVGTASVTTTSGTTTITSSAAFGSVLAGMRISGTGIPASSFVNVVNSTSSIDINQQCTASGSITATFSQAAAIPVCQDSVVFTADYFDTTASMSGCLQAPISKALRGPGNGSGTVTTIYAALPTAPGSIYGDGSLPKGYMRVYITPRRRSTSNDWNDTTPNRVNGLKNFRMKAYVWYQNK